jgi:predicted NAD/FAD-binding protein
MNRPLGLPPIIKVNEIAGGMSSYINVLTGKLTKTVIKRSTEIASLSRTDTEYIVQDSQGETHIFDHLIVTTGPYEASTLLKSLPWAEKTCNELNRIEVFKTIIAVHEDPRLMPANRDHWSVVNTRYDARHSSNTVWKKWRSKRPIFRSWVTYDAEMPDKLHVTRTYYHPKINGNYYRAQRNLVQLQGINNLWLAGLYMHDIDCHESALMSAVNIAMKLDPQSENLQKLMASPITKKDGNQ